MLLAVNVCCVVASICYIHAILARYGVSVVGVVDKCHVDSNQRCSIRGEHLASDYRHQAGETQAVESVSFFIKNTVDTESRKKNPHLWLTMENRKLSVKCFIKRHNLIHTQHRHTLNVPFMTSIFSYVSLMILLLTLCPFSWDLFRSMHFIFKEQKFAFVFTKTKH